MEVVHENEHPPELTQKPEQPLSKAQRAIKERAAKVEAEAQEAHNKLVQRFCDFIINEDNPTEEAILEKKNLISNQWKVFCRSRSLNPKALNLVFDKCTVVHNDFKQKDGSTEGESVLEAKE